MVEQVVPHRRQTVSRKRRYYLWEAPGRELPWQAEPARSRPQIYQWTEQLLVLLPRCYLDRFLRRASLLGQQVVRVRSQAKAEQLAESQEQLAGLEREPAPVPSTVPTLAEACLEAPQNL